MQAKGAKTVVLTPFKRIALERIIYLGRHSCTLFPLPCAYAMKFI
jgi:hypothetical protein